MSRAGAGRMGVPSGAAQPAAAFSLAGAVSAFPSVNAVQDGFPATGGGGGPPAAAAAAPVPLGPSKRKRAFVERVKDTLKRSCLAKIKARYRSTTRRTKRANKVASRAAAAAGGDAIGGGGGGAGGATAGSAQLQARRDSLESTMAEEIDNCRRDLNQVRQDARYIAVISRRQQQQEREGMMRHDTPAAQPEPEPGSVATVGDAAASAATAGGCDGGLSDDDSGDFSGGADGRGYGGAAAAAAAAAAGGTAGELPWYADREHIDEETYVEIMQFLEENIVQELERQQRELEADSLTHERAELAAHMQAMEQEDIEAMERLYEVSDGDSVAPSGAGCGGSALFAGLAVFDVLCPVCTERYLRQFPSYFSCKCGLRFPLKDTVMDLRQLQAQLGDSHDNHAATGCSARRLQCKVEERFGTVWLRQGCTECGFLALV